MSTLKRRRPRRSAGCEPCKSRRMKCSETKPACEECMKRGTASGCTYSSDQIIFQSENAFIEQSFKKPKLSRRKGSSPGQMSSPDSSHNGSRPRRHGQAKISFEYENAWLDKDSTLKGVADSPASLGISEQNTIKSESSDSVDEEFRNDSMTVWSGRRHLANNEILPGHGYSRWSTAIETQITSQEARALKAFFDDFLPCEIILGNHKPWTILLKSRLQQHSIIRNIVLAISRFNIGAFYSNYDDACQNRLMALEHYSAALLELQKALNDPNRALREDTLLAVNLFGVYEMVKGSSLESLYRHILGGLSILRLRGARAHMAPGVTQSIAASYQGEAIRKSLEGRTRTFFAEPEWIEVSRNWQSLGYNKWCGTELNVLLLRLTEVNATGAYNLEAAAALDEDLQRERMKWLPQSWSIPNKLLEAKSFRARDMSLCNSVFGPDSLTYDSPDAAQHKLTLASISFDYALLVLYHTYPSLQRHPDQGYLIMRGMMQAVQYLLHDGRNYTSVIVADIFGQIIHCCHWTRGEREMDWVLHCLDMSGVAIARQLGPVGKGRIREGLESEDMKGDQGSKFGNFLEAKGLDESLTTDTGIDNHLNDNDRGFRSTSFAL